MCAIPQLVSAPLNQDVIGRRKRASCYGYGRRGLDDSLQLQTAFFPFAQSEKKRRRSAPVVAVGEKDGTMPGEIEFCNLSARGSC